MLQNFKSSFNLVRYLLTLMLSIALGVSNGQRFSYPSIISKGETLADLAPVGWTVLDSAFGDLNKDGLKDAAIILQYIDSVELVNDEGSVLAQPRILIIAFKNPDGGFQLVEQSNSFILKHDNPAMDDPYQGLTISTGVLEIKFQLFYNAGSWYVTNAAYKFRYQHGQFVLIGADNFSFNRATHDYEHYSYNFLARKRILTKGNDNERRERRSSKVLTISTLKTLKTFNEPFTWEIEKDFFL